MDKSFKGILPAAGSGSRLRSVRGPKELLPVAFVLDGMTGNPRPVLVAEYAMQAMHEANVTRCVVVINDRKPELIRYFGDGSNVGLNLAYVNQPEPDGLASAVDAAFEWVADSYVCLALPDAVFFPKTAIRTIRDVLLESTADLVLAVFPTAKPEQLGPVRVACGGIVGEVLEKPKAAGIENTWGAAAWTPRFTHFLHRPPSELHGLSIGHIFNEAVQRGFHVRAVEFQSGAYADLGTGQNLAAMIFPNWREANEPQETLITNPRFCSLG